MEFINNTGHIFSLQSYDTYPTGYEYETFDYIFYIEDDYAKSLSVNNFYIKPIRVLLDRDNGDIQSLSIKIDSSIFKLIGSNIIQDKIKTGGFNIEFDENDESFKAELTKDDILILNDDAYNLVTFYVICMSPEPATWTSNILIDVTYNTGKTNEKHEYCPITVGAVFYDESEELIINGKNMGVYFPKDIIKAVYGTSVYNDVINETVYNSKVKEYLLNYMVLHGEIGNTNQLLSGLKFFGWGDKIKIVQLVRTDNDILSQYIRDFFTTTNDLLYRFEAFEHSGLVSLYVPINGESGETYHPAFGENSFWGEMKPVLEDYMSKLVNTKYDEQDIVYQKPYFDYVFTELVLKISCLRQFYQKYFLPMHSMCLSASVSTQVFANDIKYVTKPFIKITEKPTLFEAKRNSFKVLLPDTKTVYAYTQEHYVDTNYNEFNEYIPKDKESTVDFDVYYINDVCAAIPIKFILDDSTIDIFKCHLILERSDNLIMYESDFSFSNSKTEYMNFIIYPLLMNDWMTMNYWVDKKYKLHLCVNDIWFCYEFELKIPELHLIFGKLQYKYQDNLFRQINSIKENTSGDVIDFNTFMYLPSLIDVQNINFPREVVDYYNDGVLNKFIDMYRESPSIPSPLESGSIAKKYYNKVHYYQILDENNQQLPFEPYRDGDGIREDLQSESTVALYKQFFNNDGTLQNDIVVNNIHYDLYIMHDEYIENSQLSPAYWYIVLISKETIDSVHSDDDLIAPSIQIENYKVKHMSSDNKWLINRMEYISTKGINRFKPSDIIVGTINNVELPFMLLHGTKWSIKPFSLKMENDAEVHSNTNTFLMSLGGDNSGYESGYYNIIVRYSLDGVIQNEVEHKTRILVKNDIE